jgi:hypothetical protein
MDDKKTKDEINAYHASFVVMRSRLLGTRDPEGGASGSSSGLAVGSVGGPPSSSIFSTGPEYDPSAFVIIVAFLLLCMN